MPILSIHQAHWISVEGSFFVHIVLWFERVKLSPVIWYCVFFFSSMSDIRLQRFRNGTPVPPCGVQSLRYVLGGQPAMPALVSNKTCNNDSIRIHRGWSIMQEWHFQAVCDIVNDFFCIKLWTDASCVLERICWDCELP